MRILSLNVAQPRTIRWRGESILTGIFKQPVSGPLRLRSLNFDGDRQADLSVHGGPLKAVYAYASEHFPLWQAELGLASPLLPGAFGENLTTQGMTEENVSIGDQFRVGSALIMAVQRRQPCYKLVAKFDREDIADRMMENGRSGIYFSVLEEGEVRPGDAIERVAHPEHSVTIAEVNRLMGPDRMNAALLARAARATALPEGYLRRFASRLAQLERQS